MPHFSAARGGAISTSLTPCGSVPSRLTNGCLSRRWQASRNGRSVPRAAPWEQRTGWGGGQRNAVALARRFESAGVQMLTVHGGTREQGYKGAAEYQPVAAVKAAVRIPVVANGDIDSPQQAREVLAATGADAL